MGVGFLPQAAAWAAGRPASSATSCPTATAGSCPRGADVVMQVHYHRDGRVEKDRTQIGLYFAKKSAADKPFKGGIIARPFPAHSAPASTTNVQGRPRSIHVARGRCTLHSIMPHMHLVGKEIKVTLKPPEGEARTLLAIKDWDYNWQETYFLKEPLKLKVGDCAAVEAVYDNSAEPQQPEQPAADRPFGEQTTNEMCFVFLGATSDGPGRSPFVGPFGGRRRDRETTPPTREEPGDKKAVSGEERAGNEELSREARMTRD